MNKEIRKVKLISKNALESLVYYSRFNPLYYGLGWLLTIHGYTLRKSNSNYVSFTLLYSSTACG